MNKRTVRIAFAGILLLGTVVPAASANAATQSPSSSSIQPLAAQGCSGDSCIYLSTPSGGTVFTQSWAYDTTFYGYFRVSTPSGYITSPTQTWLAGKGNYFQVNGISAIVGQYCSTAYTSSGSSLGTACENVL